jgi:hypothetical protein
MKNRDCLDLDPIVLLDTEKLNIVASYIKVDVRPLQNVKLHQDFIEKYRN